MKSKIENCIIITREKDSLKVRELRHEEPMDEFLEREYCDELFHFGKEWDGKCYVNLDGYAILPVEEYEVLKKLAGNPFNR